MTAIVDPGVVAAVADAHRREWAFVLAATVRVTGDIDLGEECVQDAYARALSAWASAGVPANPGAWLTTVARRRALDLKRRDATARRAAPFLLDDDPTPGPDDQVGDRPDIDDDRLRLVFTCCHPALSPDARVALTLRLLCGLTTGEVARAFLVTESTMAARISRAKKKITAARIPYRVPDLAELPARVGAVLDVVHLLFTTGHSAPIGDDLVRRDLVERALDLTRMLRTLLPGDADVAGLLALILLTDARRDARTDDDGRLLLLAEQDRARWDYAAITEGVALVREALRRRPPGRFALMAAIAAVHDQAPRYTDTDWNEIVALYDLLVQLWPSPVVALNRAAALGLAHGPSAGLAALDALAEEPQLAGYAYLPAARADFLSRLGRTDQARLAYAEALLLTENTVERDFLTDRLAQLDR
ncbi:MAG TPA: sigma-70 family RNA polymerase sigma factor [Pseudonocardia sp.]|uniref:RNA polymerase sigma factor n=1 Tax=Pseudonocardia sp. TaxID=60912 RepID=UPI002C0B80B7|nr:sigma-70 family RNA polymerase sigma factor [Pseudonocardia sp.]HTF49518.1 sigma-70 family RNA polymerase sigma factor [Pseudonocardia sp.]